MAAGTLSVTNNSKAVVGVGTTFTAFASGDFLSLVVGQVPYTVAIASIESDTALTLVLPFDGPTATGLAWDGVKRDTMSLATMGVTVQAQKALRFLIADENNWRAIFGDAEEITVTLPNGQVMQGMSWGYLSELLKNVDPVEMRDLAAQAEASKSAAQGYRNEAEGFKTETAGIRDATNQIKADTQAIHDATNTIKTQTDQIKTDTQAIKDQTNQIKTDTGVMRDEANTAKTDAQAASTAAQGFRDQAEEWAQSVNADNLLTKSGNLAGLTDKPQAWLNVRPDGATPLAGDPVGDYDATTKRWVENLVNIGTVGPTMNGVMNYGVGDFHLRDSRAYIQPYEVCSDGQLLNRADWPDLWAYAQMTSPIEDADWLADPANRGKYSTGDGETTFRVPDRNGVQTGSISGLYARGDGGNSANDGTVQQNAAPNITGTVGAAVWSAYGASTGVFKTQGPVASPPMLSTTTTPAPCVRFEAGLDNAAYGRDNTTEVRTNSFIGVWVIRASGGFVAANTSWSVINGAAASPANGTTVKGGKVRSVYKVGTSEYGVAELQSSVSTDGTGARTVGAEVVVTDATSGIATSKTIKLGTVDGLTGGEIGSIITVRGAGLQPKLVASHLDYNPALGGNAIWIVGMTGTENIMQYATEVTGQYYSLTTVFRVSGQQQFWSQTSTGRYLTPLGELAIQGSDVRIKEDFTPPKEGAWDRVKSIGICEFKYKGQNVTKRGFLAQQMGEIDPVYTFEGGTAHDDDGNEFEILNVNDKAVLADVITVMQMMQDKIEEMEAEIAALKK